MSLVSDYVPKLIVASTCTQTTSVFGNTPRKQKLKLKIRNVVRSNRRLSRVLKKPKTPPAIEKFKEMCDTFLPKEMSNFVKYQAETHSISSRALRYSNKYKQLTLTLHFLGPKVYRFLRNVFRLPTERTVRRITQNWSISPGICERLFSILALRIQHFRLEARECILCADEMSLKSNLFYNIADDTIVGFHDVNTRKTFEPACMLWH